MKRRRVVIVDNDDTTRSRIRNLIASYGRFEVIAECSSGREASSAVREHAPEVIFLSVRLPDAGGFELLDGVQDSTNPAVVVLSSNDELAIEAFRVHAVDYLVKPLEDERLRTTLDRLDRHCRLLESEQLTIQMTALLDGREAKTPENNTGDRRVPNGDSHPPSDRIIVKDGDTTRLVRVDSIDWIEADDYFAKIHVGTGHYMLRVSLNRLEKMLDPARFVRIHRSTIVNIDRIHELEPWANRAYIVILKDGTHLRMSRYRRSELVDALGRTP